MSQKHPSSESTSPTAQLDELPDDTLSQRADNADPFEDDAVTSVIDEMWESLDGQ